MDQPSSARHETMLYLNGVSVSFDGFKAINNLSIIVQPAEMLAIIGPNGAGKTTMMDIITGKTRPDAGEVYFDGRTDLTKLDEAAIANLGIGRKFQKPTVFESHTVWDNLEMALKTPRTIFSALFYTPSEADIARIEDILDTVRLSAKKQTYAADLSHGQKQWLEIGMLLMQEPELLMLDEPIAGMSAKERDLTAELLHRICQNRAVIVIEHDMDFVKKIAHKVTVMHQGKILAEGPMDQVQADPKVIDVYLGH